MKLIRHNTELLDKNKTSLVRLNTRDINELNIVIHNEKKSAEKGMKGTTGKKSSRGTSFGVKQRGSGKQSAAQIQQQQQQQAFSNLYQNANQVPVGQRMLGWNPLTDIASQRMFEYGRNREEQLTKFLTDGTDVGSQIQEFRNGFDPRRIREGTDTTSNTSFGFADGTNRFVIPPRMEREQGPIIEEIEDIPPVPQEEIKQIVDVIIPQVAENIRKQRVNISDEDAIAIFTVLNDAQRGEKEQAVAFLADRFKISKYAVRRIYKGILDEEKQQTTPEFIEPVAEQPSISVPRTYGQRLEPQQKIERTKQTDVRSFFSGSQPLAPAPAPAPTPAPVEESTVAEEPQVEFIEVKPKKARKPRQKKTP